MTNQWFQFKEFKVDQNQCGMKVSTDACILGALAAQFLFDKKNLRTVLDIGTGTGLLSLMLAQKSNAIQIDAIEIDEEAAHQARQNFSNSKWDKQLTCIPGSLSEWSEKSVKNETLYDLIICNPPFFQNHLLSQESQRKIARHNISLSSESLISHVSTLLKDSGIFCVLFPKSGWTEFERLANLNGLFSSEVNYIQPKQHLEANRVIAFFTKKENPIVHHKNLIIYAAEKEYTNGFKTLLQDYYLHL